MKLAHAHEIIKTMNVAILLGLLVACTPAKKEKILPPGKYSGKPVDFSVRFIGAGVIDSGILSDSYLLNKPVICSYQFGSQKGTFTTPATVKLRLSLRNVCVHGMFFLNSRR